MSCFMMPPFSKSANMVHTSNCKLGNAENERGGEGDGGERDGKEEGGGGDGDGDEKGPESK
jgi:hypothetical protein